MATVATAIGPALIDQVTTDDASVAWLLLGAYALVAAAALAVAHRWPFGAFLMVLLPLGAAEVGAAALEVRISSLAVLPLAFASYALGAYSALRRAVLALLTGAAVVVFGVWLNHATAPDDRRGGSDVLALLTPLPAAWALGMVARGRREEIAAAERRAEHARREQRLREEQAATAERLRIARDMHDVVAHSLTLLVVHAEALRARGDQLPAWAREEVDAMAASGRQTTAELREVLGFLRRVGQGAPRGPVPTLADLPHLVETARQAGTPVSLRVSDRLTSLPRPIQLVAYRIVQECLSNARKHAPGAEVGVRADVTDEDTATFDITCGPPPADHPGTPGTGIGLIGLGERVKALSGTMRAGPAPNGGFHVRCTVPLRSRDG
ncbi:two-component sensor histidine kinase [Streptomyces radicis]|uniref:histidine kinase n=1 Tax=Streptomyces radicis TaxID=1750517 RepID=A0A3A9WKM9_9ACTN|nr:two-component sensor histidine kinase [Streptomyces radicis]RKN27382.1 two-component sensor histidine kinase [Streptomyces radicis]